MGSSVGTLVFVKYGWRAAAGLNLAWMGFQIVVLLLRGPHCERRTWLGYEGGLGWETQGALLKEKEEEGRASEGTVTERDPGAKEAASDEKGV